MHGGEFQLWSKLREGTEATAVFPPSRVMEALPAIPTFAPVDDADWLGDVEFQVRPSRKWRLSRNGA